MPTSYKYTVTAGLGLILLVGVGVFFNGDRYPTQPTPAEQQATEGTNEFAFLRTDGRCLQLEVADTPAARRQGLSGRTELPAGQGMLFVYQQSGEYGFWMKDMNFAIDIIWIDENDQVVTIKRSAAPSSYPKTFYPAAAAKNVIETPAGFTQTANINSGDQLNLVGPTTTTPGAC